jgi:hypothetical protein
MAPKVKRRRLDPPTKAAKDDVPPPAAAPATETATTSTNGANGEMATEPKFETLQLHAGYRRPSLACRATQLTDLLLAKSQTRPPTLVPCPSMPPP